MMMGMNGWDYYVVTPALLVGGLLLAFLIVSTVVTRLFCPKRRPK